jgi:hypothetical protein
MKTILIGGERGKQRETDDKENMACVLMRI